MKRFLLSSMLLLAMGRVAFGYINTGTVVNPQDVIDDPNFVNKGVFSVDTTLIQSVFSGNTFLYTTSDTLNYTNTGLMIGIPGYDLENFPASVGQAQMSANFVNIGNGLGGGVISITNIYGGGVFAVGTALGVPITSLGLNTPGLAMFRARATNILDSGLITMDDTGLIDLAGGDLNLNRGQFIMSGGNVFSGSAFGISYLDYGSGITNIVGWVPAADLTATTALSPTFQSTVTGNFEEMDLTNATSFVSQTLVGTNLIIWDNIYLQDFSPTNVTKNVYFDSLVGGFRFGEQTVEWIGTYRDQITGASKTNYFYLVDNPDIRRNTNTFFPPGIPTDLNFFESPVELINQAPAVPIFFNPAPDSVVTNDFAYADVRPSAALVDTNSVIGGSPTNLLGRIQLTATHSLSLANTHIIGPNYLKLDSRTAFLGNSNALVEAPYSDLYLSVTNGSLTLSNLLVSQLPTWTGVPGAPSAVFNNLVLNQQEVEMGGLQVWAGSYIFLDANGVTNDVRVMLVNSALQPTTPALQQDMVLHSPDSLTISDEYNIIRNFSSDAAAITLTTNSNSAFSLSGQLNLLSQNIFWSSASVPNLQYLTNWGRISTKNLANFADNMFSPNSDPANATPYQAFVNHGTVASEGVLIRANYFENSGVIDEDQANSIDIGVGGTAWATNGSFLASAGEVAIAANSLLASNGVIQAGSDLTLTMQCYLSDGYAFENQFGHITNSVLPNVVTNGNTWVVGGGVRIMNKPTTGDLLGTTITNLVVGGRESINYWAGEDRGASPGGYATNLALGRMILNADANPSQFTFRTLSGSNALYVDSLELQGNTTNTDINGNPQSIAIDPGMTIYYAQAIENGVSIAEKLNGKHGAANTSGGRFFWVSNYAGVYSSTNIPYPDGNTYIFNKALAVSPDIDSDGDGTVNVNDSTPISIGTVFDISNIGPLPCDGSGGSGSSGDTNGSEGSATSALGVLVFPNHASSSGSSAPVSFTLAQGSYNGLFSDTNGVNPVSSGFFTAKVTSKGGLTAKLQLGTHTYSFSKPPFDASGHFNGQVTGKGATPLTVDLQLVNNDEITGTVSGNGWKAKLLAEREAFSAKNKAPWAGNDTLLLSTTTNCTTAAGDSFASVTISSSGAVQWSGMLPDGSKISQKSALSKDGVWPLYAAPYNGAGVFIGWMQCTNNPDITGSGVWVAPAGANGLYRSGLTNDLNATGSTVTGIVSPSIKTILSGASLDSALTNRVTISGKIGQSSNALKLSINTKTGVFSGTMVDPNSTQVLSLQGAFLEGSGISGGGFFLSADKTLGGKISLAPAQ
ncbi:MAG TPA: hypothetical protein VG938_00055 [Verrucomicrobiae bacterium]|jgi:hypothetical protein|nr:hypothetical protein [Verrucomicrobiae bacterium]